MGVTQVSSPHGSSLRAHLSQAHCTMLLWLGPSLCPDSPHLQTPCSHMRLSRIPVPGCSAPCPTLLHTT